MRVLVAMLLATGCFAVAVTLEPMLAYSPIQARHDRPPIEVLLGDGRRLFAAHFFAKADAYFHRGFYPSIFDKRDAFDAAHGDEGAAMAAEKDQAIEHHEEPDTPEGHDHDEHAGHDHSAGECADHASHAKKGETSDEARDFIERFSRSFYPSVHQHLGEGHLPDPFEAREILPWLRLAAELDPNRIETYTVAAFWLRTRLHKAREAEQFLMDGLRANPGHYAILFELGRVYAESYQEPLRARNVWEAALSRWRSQEGSKPEPDTFFLSQVLWHLALVEKEQGRVPQAVAYLKEAKAYSPKPEMVQARIDEWEKTAP